MSKFLEVLESYHDEVGDNGCDSFAAEVKHALESKGLTCTWMLKSPKPSTLFVQGDSGEFSVTIACPSEDEEYGNRGQDKEMDKASASMDMADKATNDDPQAAQSKRNLTTQVTKTYGQLDRTLRDATSKLR